MRERIDLALVHHPTLDRTGRVGATAVTTLDLHDLARLARTYGLGGLWVVTPLEAQRGLTRRLLDHWVSGPGGRANPCRQEALAGVRLTASLEETIAELTVRWGRPVRVVATSAREEPGRLSFAAARAGFATGADPVLLVFGTGWGLAPEALALCPEVLEPIRGAGPYNHLSVRSAASITVDRLFGGDRASACEPALPESRSSAASPAVDA